MDSDLAVRALGALAHESRLAVFRLLIEAGPAGLAAGVISDALGVAPSALSFHLKDLVHSDMASMRYEGRKIFYAAKFETMNALIGYLQANCCQGVACAIDSEPACCP